MGATLMHLGRTHYADDPAEENRLSRESVSRCSLLAFDLPLRDFECAMARQRGFFAVFGQTLLVVVLCYVYSSPLGSAEMIYADDHEHHVRRFSAKDAVDGTPVEFPVPTGGGVTSMEPGEGPDGFLMRNDTCGDRGGGRDGLGDTLAAGIQRKYYDDCGWTEPPSQTITQSRIYYSSSSKDYDTYRWTGSIMVPPAVGSGTFEIQYYFLPLGEWWWRGGDIVPGSTISYVGCPRCACCLKNAEHTATVTDNLVIHRYYPLVVELVTQCLLWDTKAWMNYRKSGGSWQQMGDEWFHTQTVEDCEAGWGGPDCTCSDAGTCNGRGTCKSDGSCDCNLGYDGPNCECSDVTDCASPRGFCTASATCSCNAGYDGPNCECSDAVDCQGNGECTADGSCLCYEGHDGPNCECDDSVDCNGNGECTSAGACLCYEGYGGADCSCVDAVDCLGQGECNAVGNCVCDTYFDGPHCECNDFVNCSAPHGSCKSDASCLCLEGYDGSHCECGDVETCHSQGECIADGSCACYEGFDGPECLCSDADTCSGQGECDSSGTCVCHAGYNGTDCACSDVNSCNFPHGRCGGDGKCLCDPLYVGLNCTVQCDAAAVCHGHGECSPAGDGTCQCFGVWSGPFCNSSTEFCDTPSSASPLSYEYWDEQFFKLRALASMPTPQIDYAFDLKHESITIEGGIVAPDADPKLYDLKVEYHPAAEFLLDGTLVGGHVLEDAGLCNASLPVQELQVDSVLFSPHRSHTFRIRYRSGCRGVGGAQVLRLMWRTSSPPGAWVIIPAAQLSDCAADLLPSTCERGWYGAGNGTEGTECREQCVSGTCSGLGLCIGGEEDWCVCSQYQFGIDCSQFCSPLVNCSVPSGVGPPDIRADKCAFLEDPTSSVGQIELMCKCYKGFYGPNCEITDASSLHITNAKFSDDCSMIRVGFSQETNRARVPLNKILSQSTVDTLGGVAEGTAKPFVTWSSTREMVIYVGWNPTIRAGLHDEDPNGDEVWMSPDSILKMRYQEQITVSHEGVWLQPPANPPTPVARVGGPRRVDVFAEEAWYSAAWSSGAAGRPMSYRWGLQLTNDSGVVIQVFEALVESGSPEYMFPLRDVVPALADAVAPQTLEFPLKANITLVAENWLGKKSNMTIVEVTLEGDFLPLVSMVHPGILVTFRARALWLSSYVSVPTNASLGVAQLGFQWRQIAGPDAPFLASTPTARSRTLHIPHHSLQVGEYYTFELSVWSVTAVNAALGPPPPGDPETPLQRAVRAGVNMANASQELYVYPQNLVAVVAGGDRIVPTNISFTLTSEGSFDPDLDSSPFNASWHAVYYPAANFSANVTSDWVERVATLGFKFDCFDVRSVDNSSIVVTPNTAADVCAVQQNGLIVFTLEICKSDLDGVPGNVRCSRAQSRVWIAHTGEEPASSAVGPESNVTDTVKVTISRSPQALLGNSGPPMPVMTVNGTFHEAAFESVSIQTHECLRLYGLAVPKLKPETQPSKGKPLVEYWWDVAEDSGSDVGSGEVEWFPASLATPRTLRNLVLPPLVLEPGSCYMFRLSSTVSVPSTLPVADLEAALAQLGAVTGVREGWLAVAAGAALRRVCAFAGPWGGSIQMSGPALGTAVLTRYIFSAVGWSGLEGIADVSVGLKYRFGAALFYDDPSSGQPVVGPEIPLTSVRSQPSAVLRLPGDPLQDPATVRVFVTVYDLENATAKAFVDVQLRYPTPGVLLQEVSEILETAVRELNAEDIAQLLCAMATVFNGAGDMQYPDSSGYGVGSLQWFGSDSPFAPDAMVVLANLVKVARTALETMSLSAEETVQLSTCTGRLVYAVPRHISLDLQTELALLGVEFAKSVNVVGASIRDTVPALLHILDTVLLGTGGLNVSEVISSAKSNPGGCLACPAPVSSSSASVPDETETLLNGALEQLSSATQTQTTCGERALTFDSRTMQMAVEKTYLDDTNIAVGTGGGSSVLFGASIVSSQVPGVDPGDVCITAELVNFLANPHQHNNEDLPLGSDVVTMHLKWDDGTEMKVMDADPPIEILIRSDLSDVMDTVVPGGCDKAYTTYKVDCAWFDAGNQTWNTSGCVRDDERSTGNLTVCLCTHLTDFGVLVMPKFAKTVACGAAEKGGNYAVVVIAIASTLFVLVLIAAALATIFLILPALLNFLGGLGTAGVGTAGGAAGTGGVSGAFKKLVGKSPAEGVLSETELSELETAVADAAGYEAPPVVVVNPAVETGWLNFDAAAGVVEGVAEAAVTPSSAVEASQPLVDVTTGADGTVSAMF